MQGITFCVILVVLIIILAIQYAMNLKDLKEAYWQEEAEKEHIKNKELQYQLDHVQINIDLEVRGFDK